MAISGSRGVLARRRGEREVALLRRDAHLHFRAVAREGRRKREREREERIKDKGFGFMKILRDDGVSFFAAGGMSGVRSFFLSFFSACFLSGEQGGCPDYG